MKKKLIFTVLIITGVGAYFLSKPSPTNSASVLANKKVNKPKNIKQIPERLKQSAKLTKIENTSETSTRTPLMIAAYQGNLEAISEFIKRNSDLEIQDQDGFTPLLNAINGNQLEAALLLFKNGASLKAQSKNGDTAISLAVGNGNVELAKLALENGADPNQQINNAQFSMLMASVYDGDIEMIDLLLSYEASPNHQDKDGITALMIASKEGFEQTVIKLLSHGADKTIKDKNDRIARDYARGSNFFNIIKLLEDN